MRMKKWIAGILVLVMALSFAGCKKGSKAEEVKEVPFTGQELVNNEICRFQVNAVQYMEFEGFTLSVEMENFQDMGVRLNLVNASVNGCMCNPEWEDTLGAKEKKTGTILFPENRLSQYGITDVTRVDFTLMLCDEETGEQVLLEEAFSLYPKGEQAATAYTREKKDTDRVLLDNDYCTIIMTGYDPESFWGYDLYLYVVNKTDDMLMLTVKDEMLNGVSCDAFWRDSTMAPNTCTLSTIHWFDDRLEKAGITDVQSITVTVLADAEFALCGELFTQTITIEP